jgi:hypothetical protein
MANILGWDKRKTKSISCHKQYGHFSVRFHVVKTITYLMKKELHSACPMFFEFLIKYKYKLPHDKQMA